jgi:hypothetical protein
VEKTRNEVTVCAVMKSTVRKLPKLNLLGLHFYQFYNLAYTCSYCTVLIYSAHYQAFSYLINIQCHMLGSNGVRVFLISNT